jgi:hypothetical protein
VKTKLSIAVAIAGIFGGGVLQASTVISCGWDTAALNSCLSGGLTNFQTKLDWAAFGTPDGTVHTTLWTAASNGFTIGVSEAGLGSGQGAWTAYNYDSVYIGGAWVPRAIAAGSYPQSFAGHFDSITNPANLPPASPGGPGQFGGDHLMGFAGAGGALNSTGLIIDFNASINALGFRVASTSNTTFNLTLNLFSGAGGTGTNLGSFTLNGLTGGGTCSSLYSVGATNPTACNDALFIAAMNAAGTRSATVTTNDIDGFFLGDLYVDSVPEPTPFIFAGCGLLLLIIGKKKFNGAA